MLLRPGVSFHSFCTTTGLRIVNCQYMFAPFVLFRFQLFGFFPLLLQYAAVSFLAGASVFWVRPVVLSLCCDHASEKSGDFCGNKNNYNNNYNIVRQSRFPYVHPNNWPLSRAAQCFYALGQTINSTVASFGFPRPLLRVLARICDTIFVLIFQWASS